MRCEFWRCVQVYDPLLLLVFVNCELSIQIMKQRGLPAPNPGRLPMAILFSKIYKTLEPCVNDSGWQSVRRAALQFLTDFAQVSLACDYAHAAVFEWKSHNRS